MWCLDFFLFCCTTHSHSHTVPVTLVNPEPVRVRVCAFEATLFVEGCTVMSTTTPTLVTGDTPVYAATVALSVPVVPPHAHAIQKEDVCVTCNVQRVFVVVQKKCDVH